MTTARVPSWGLSLHRAEYYGVRWCAHVGPYLIFFWPIGDKP